MRRRLFLSLVAIGLLLVSLGLVVGTTVAQSSVTELELEAADDTDTDRSTVSFTFTTQENATTATIIDTLYRPSNDVTFRFEQWEQVGGISSGTNTNFDVNGETTYRLVYSVEATSGASEGTYSDEFDATISYEDKASETASGSLSATVSILNPEFSTISDQSVDATFRPDDGSTLQETVQIDISNIGDGFMNIEDASTFRVPSYMSASVDSLPNRIDAGSSGTGEIEIEIDEFISEGTYSFDTTITDSLGNTESLTVTIEIIKPPAVGISRDTVDLGEILVGEDGTAEFELTERNGFKSISGIESSPVTVDRQGSISFPGLNSQSISSEASTTQTVEINVDDDVSQGEELRWQVYFTPDDNEGIGTEQSMTFIADVIYPPYYEDISMVGSDLVFDEPREDTERFTDQTTVDVSNGGDLRMDLRDITATVPNNQNIDVAVVDNPGSIDAGSTETITLEVDASTDSEQGDYDIMVEVTASEPTSAPGEQTGTATTSATVTVEHKTELRIDRTKIEAGEIIVTEQSEESATIQEYLGYQPIEEFSLTQVSGPEEGWLTVAEQPNELAAGEQADFITNIQFDTSAELYQTYTWVFEATGANVKKSTITVEATPEPVNFEQTISELENIGDGLDGDSESVALEMAETLSELEQTLQEGGGEATQNDITVLVTAGRSSILFLNSVQEAESLIDQENYEEAQAPVVRASSAFNTFSIAIEDITSPTFQSRADGIQQRAGTVLTELIERQEDYYLDQLEDTNVLEQAQIQRELARLAELSGDQQRADELRGEAKQAFNNYSDLISSGTENLASARELQGDLERNVFISPGGFRLFLISSLSTYNSQSDKVLSYYDDAIEQFETAGATERASLAASERADIKSAYEDTYLRSIGVGVFAAVVLLLFVIWEARAIYRYRLDSEDAVSGDFLLPWAETE